MPAHSGLFWEVVKMALLARAICSRISRSASALASSRPSRSTARGFHASFRPSVMSDVAMPLATSPAL